MPESLGRMEPLVIVVADPRRDLGDTDRGRLGLQSFPPRGFS